MEITTETLAELLAHASREGRNQDAAPDDAGLFDARDRQAWFTVLLHQTLKYAEESVPFYRNRTGRQCPAASSFERLADLALYPVLTKAQVAKNLSSLLSEKAECQTVHCTSGTTARRLHIYSNYEEERAADLLRQLVKQPGETDRLVLRIVPGPRRLYSPTHPGHGSQVLVVGYSSNQDNHQWFDYTDHLAEVLNSDYWFGRQARRIAVIHITPPWMLEFITRKLLDRGVDPAEFGVGLIGVSGGFTTTRTRRIVQDTWKAEYTSSYSCSEITMGEARESRDAAGVYIPGPSFYCEIVDPESFEAVEPGEHGLVLVTSLYPFQQVMPFIRYNTGDIAERTRLPGDRRQSGDSQVTAFRPIGRLEDCLRLGRRQYFGTREVLESLAGHHEIPHVPYPRYELSLEGRGKRRTVRLRVETVEMSGHKRDWLRSQILNNLYTEYKRSAQRGNFALTFDCELVGKDDLKAYHRLVPSR